MPWNLISSIEGVGTNTFTTGAADTTGADLLIAHVSRYVVNAPTLTDSKGNTWTALTLRDPGINATSRLYYAKNPTVGTGHTFTLTGSGSIYAVLHVEAWSGADLTAPLQSETGATTAAASSLATGSLTPAQDNSLIIAGVGGGNDVLTFTINASMVISNQQGWVSGGNFAGALAHLVQATAAAINPTWNWSVSGAAGVGLAVFKPAAAGGGPLSGSGALIDGPLYSGRLAA